MTTNKKPYDLGPQIDPNNLQEGTTYYLKSPIDNYNKITIINIYGRDDIYLEIQVIDEKGKTRFLTINVTERTNYRQDTNKFYIISDIKSKQKSLGEIFTLKTPISSQPGHGPANNIRRFLNIQPTKKGGKTKKRSRRKH